MNADLEIALLRQALLDLARTDDDGKPCWCSPYVCRDEKHSLACEQARARQAVLDELAALRRLVDETHVSSVPDAVNTR